MILESNQKQARILLVDDEKTNIRLLEVILEQAGYENVFSTTDPRQVESLVASLNPDVMLLDLFMPYLNGLEVIQRLQAQYHDRMVPVLMLTSDHDRTSKYKALAAGAKDFLLKPLDEIDVLLRLQNLLETRFHYLLLEEKVQKRTQDLETAQLETLECLALAAEYRDDTTGLHTKRVGVTCARIAEALGFPTCKVEQIQRAAPLHDVGKIGIADLILLKPGKLTVEEFATMKQHTTIGYNILSSGSSPLLQLAAEIALHHHERWDGTGYFGLKETAIPVAGRIAAIADQFDALTHERPYKQAWPIEKALREIESLQCHHFDPQLVKVFLQLPHHDLV